MDADRVLAFRLARSGLVARGARGLAEAAACPASDFARDASLLALAARAEGVSREAYRQAVDDGDLVVAHIVRGAIHALAPGDLALYGRALIARDDGDLRRNSAGRSSASPPTRDSRPVSRSRRWRRQPRTRCRTAVRSARTSCTRS